MRSVAVIGIGKTAFGAFADRDLRSLGVEAGRNCLADGGVSPSQIEAFYLGNFAGPSFVGQNHLAPYIAGAMGINGVPCTRFEAACASRELSSSEVVRQLIADYLVRHGVRWPTEDVSEPASTV